MVTDLNIAISHPWWMNWVGDLVSVKAYVTDTTAWQNLNMKNFLRWE